MPTFTEVGHTFYQSSRHCCRVRTSLRRAAKRNGNTIYWRVTRRVDKSFQRGDRAMKQTCDGAFTRILGRNPSKGGVETRSRHDGASAVTLLIISS